MEAYDVFLSYRRGAGAETARLIRLALIERGYRVFLDVDDLAGGHFDDRLLEIIEATPNFVLVLSEGALDRAHDASDWVRIEVEHALEAGCAIVPVTMPGFKFGDQEELPGRLAELPRHNAVSYSHEYFDASIEKLVEYMPRAAVKPAFARAAGQADPETQRPLTEAEYGGYAEEPLAALIVLGLLTAWAYVAQRLGRRLLRHLELRARWFESRAGNLKSDPDWTLLTDKAFRANPMLVVISATGCAGAGLFTVGIVIWFFWVRDFPVNSSAPAVLFAAAGIVFYASVACIVMWFWRTLKLHDRYERLCWQRLADSRVSVTTLPDAAYVSRWRDLDAHAALFLIVAFPAMLLPGIAAWRFLQFGPGQFAGLPVPLWILIVAGIMHGWGLWLLTTMLHRHLQAETA